MYDLEKQKKKVKKKKKLVIDEELSKTIRVNFPWLATPMACRAKAYIAYVADRKYKLAISTGSRKKFFDTIVLPSVLRRFPKLYRIIRSYYHEKGKALNQEHFEELLRARYMNMYDAEFKKTHEHPAKSGHAVLHENYSLLSNRKR
jgi:hypothetical protein